MGPQVSMTRLRTASAEWKQQARRMMRRTLLHPPGSTRATQRAIAEHDAWVLTAAHLPSGLWRMRQSRRNRVLFNSR